MIYLSKKSQDVLRELLEGSMISIPLAYPDRPYMHPGDGPVSYKIFKQLQSKKLIEEKVPGMYGITSKGCEVLDLYKDAEE